MPRIVDSILVDDDCPDKSTELDQSVPIANRCARAETPRSQVRPDATFADRCQQSLKARPIDATGRAPKIIVDNLNRGPAELHDQRAHIAAAGFLDCARVDPALTDGYRRTRSGQDGHRRPPRPRGPLRSRVGALRPVSSAPPSVLAPARRLARTGRTVLIAAVNLRVISLFLRP